MDARENRLRGCLTIHLQYIVDEGACQGISADLIALRAGEQTIQTVEIGFAAFDQLIQKFGLILQPARMRDAASIAAMSRRYVEAGLSPAWTVERVVRSIRHRDSTVLTATLSRALAGIAIMTMVAYYISWSRYQDKDRKSGFGVRA